MLFYELISQQAIQSEIEHSGRQDELATVLEKREHLERVLAAGKEVSITQYFGRKNEKQVEDNDSIVTIKAKIEFLKRKCAELETKTEKRRHKHEREGEIPSEKKSCQFPKGWTQYQLASP